MIYCLIAHINIINNYKQAIMIACKAKYAKEKENQNRFY